MADRMTRGPDGPGVWCDGPVDDPLAAHRAAAEAALGHPVPHLLVPGGEGALVAASLAGDLPRARVAWIGADGDVLARVACPPGRPSRWRPVVAAVVALEMPPLPDDRILVARVAPEATSVVPLLAAEGGVRPVPAGGEGLVLMRLPAEAPVIGVDALDASGEPIGRLARAGISELRFDGASVSGRMGATHGMGAGIGDGRWASGLADAAFEVGYAPWLPDWMPPGLTRGLPRIEPDVSYPSAPPAVIVAWTGADGSRVLLRQCPAPLASPDAGGRDARVVEVDGARAVLRVRGLVTLVWETDERAFGLQVRGAGLGEETALRVARSISPRTPA
jgi:hypothetical protein